MVCNITRSPEVASGGPDWPVLVLNSIIALVNPGGSTRLATTTEYFASLGINMFKDRPGFPKQSNLAPIIEALPPNKAKALAGNGQNIVIEAAWIFYVLGNAVSKREDHSRPALKRLRTFVDDEHGDIL